MVIKTILPTEEENIKILIIQIIKQRYKLHRMHNYIYFSRNFCYNLHEFEHFDIQKISATRTFFSLIKKKKNITWGPQSKRYDASQLLVYLKNIIVFMKNYTKNTILFNPTTIT